MEKDAEEGGKYRGIFKKVMCSDTSGIITRLFSMTGNALMRTGEHKLTSECRVESMQALVDRNQQSLGDILEAQEEILNSVKISTPSWSDKYRNPRHGSEPKSTSIIS